MHRDEPNAYNYTQTNMAVSINRFPNSRWIHSILKSHATWPPLHSFNLFIHSTILFISRFIMRSQRRVNIYIYRDKRAAHFMLSMYWVISWDSPPFNQIFNALSPLLSLSLSVLSRSLPKFHYNHSLYINSNDNFISVIRMARVLVFKA